MPARHFGAPCIGNRIGLILCFPSIHSARALDHANHRLAAGVHVDVLDRDFLLTFAALTIERVK